MVEVNYENKKDHQFKEIANGLILLSLENCKEKGEIKWKFVC